MNTLTSNQRVLIAALIGFIIGAGAVWVWSIANVAQNNSVAVSKQDAAFDDAEDSTDESLAAVAGSGAAADDDADAPAAIDDEPLSVLSREAGNEVAFRANLEEAGWIAIHDDRDGGLGNALGAQWFPAGAHAGSVSLLRNTEAGKTYHAVLYVDDGDRIFTVRGEAFVLDGSKQPIRVTFVAQ